MAAVTILADENIPYAREAFRTVGTVRLEHGRRITRDHLRDVDLLVVRSITQVDARLLEGTPVRFVGTATSGSDHVATDELRRLGIAFYAALGCNANAVAEYMVAAWLAVARRHGRTLAGRHVGIVGVGHVGSLVAEKVRALGMIPVLNDPPKARESGSADYRPLEELLDCDIVTCHTPLTYAGPDPSFHLIGARFLSRLRRGAWLCNAGRGEVVDETALRASLEDGRPGALVLDVWDHEPEIDARVLARADIGTPHIAGYSLEGKLNGTAMVYEEACRFLGVAPVWDAGTETPAASAAPPVTVTAGGRPDIDALADIVAAAYDVQRDSGALGVEAARTPADRGRRFDELRRTYPARREFRHTAVSVTGGSPALQETLRALQFSLS